MQLPAPELNNVETDLVETDLDESCDVAPANPVIVAEITARVQKQLTYLPKRRNERMELHDEPASAVDIRRGPTGDGTLVLTRSRPTVAWPESVLIKYRKHAGCP